MADEHLKARIAELEAEMEASGVEDATAWEKWDEYERLIYALAEHEVMRASRRRKAMKRIAGLLAAAAISAALVMPGMAHATSLPYVEDVNPYGSGKSVATVVCYGGHGPFKLKVTDERGKRVKVHRHRKGVWTVVLRNGEAYKVSVREKGEGWKSIGYCVY